MGREKHTCKLMINPPSVTDGMRGGTAEHVAHEPAEGEWG